MLSLYIYNIYGSGLYILFASLPALWLSVALWCCVCRGWYVLSLRVLCARSGWFVGCSVTCPASFHQGSINGLSRLRGASASPLVLLVGAALLWPCFRSSCLCRAGGCLVVRVVVIGCFPCRGVAVLLVVVLVWLLWCSLRVSCGRSWSFCSFLGACCVRA